ncbi:MAG TPA: carboxypeptidase-like regulatory domain-containing protein [Candidatus Baltobacteraceae bacterium]|nr:carboxypeptidase-like regulatory domain-containing protein [Candidatus Baltobacteraceae bacterium]
MTRARLAALALSLAALAGCNGNGVPPAQNYATITGRAYDAASNQPVAGVTVTVDTILSATTGSDGTYRIVNVPIGSYHVGVTPPAGYTAAANALDDGSVTAGQTIEVDVPLNKS